VALVCPDLDPEDGAANGRGVFASVKQRSSAQIAYSYGERALESGCGLGPVACPVVVVG
jgi:hypothetical protein